MPPLSHRALRTFDSAWPSGTSPLFCILVFSCIKPAKSEKKKVGMGIAMGLFTEFASFDLDWKMVSGKEEDNEVIIRGWGAILW